MLLSPFILLVLSQDPDQTAIAAPRRPLRDRLYQLNLTGTDTSVEIFRGEEPADIVAQTALQLGGLPNAQQDAILDHLCQNVPCKKTRMRRHTMFVLGLGKLDIGETADPVDSVGIFMDQHNKLGHTKSYHKWRVQNMLCGAIKCPQSVLSTLDLEWGGKPVQLQITNTEPPKKIASQFCAESGCEAEHEQQIVSAIHNQLNQANEVKLAAVARRQAVDRQQFELNVTGVGKLTIHPIEEPVDAVHAFCQEHGLDEKAQQQLLQHLCQQPKVKCGRTQPRRKLFTVSLQWDGSQHELEVGDLDEPKALAEKFCTLYGCLDHVDAIHSAISDRLASFQAAQPASQLTSGDV